MQYKWLKMEQNVKGKSIGYLDAAIFFITFILCFVQVQIQNSCIFWIILFLKCYFKINILII